jgi:hypothetical protein
VKHLSRFASVLALGLIVAACGGGGGDGGSGGGGDGGDAAEDAALLPPPQTLPDTTQAAAVAGLYSGSTGTGVGVEALILADGRMYAILGTNGIDSVFFGNGTLAGGTFTSNAGAKLSGSSGIASLPAAVTLTGVPTTSISGTVTGPQLSATFTANYRSLFEVTPSLASVAGSYGGTFAGLGGGDGFLLTLVVSPAGVISGTTASGCGHAGTLAPNARANVYDVSITFGSGCRKRGTITGHALLEPAAGVVPATLTVFAATGDFTDAWLFFGGRN